MDLAVAPDTGELYVSTQSELDSPIGPFCGAVPCGVLVVGSSGLFFSKSSDGGQTWTPPMLMYQTYVANVGFDGAPRVKAGPNGLVIVSYETNSFDAVSVSHDGGMTWSQNIGVHPAGTTLPENGGEGALNDPVAMSSTGNDGKVSLIYGGYAEGFSGYRSTDFGATWSSTPTALAKYPDNVGDVWTRAVGDNNGNAYAEYRYGSAKNPLFGVGFLQWRADGTVSNVDLVNAAGVKGNYEVGDDYGAVSVAADGSVWMAWSDPRGSEHERIAVTRVVP